MILIVHDMFCSLATTHPVQVAGEMSYQLYGSYTNGRDDASLWYLIIATH